MKKAMAITITFGMPKGGSGKTTLCLLVANEFARRGFKVRILVADPQATASKWFARTKAAGKAPTNIEVVAAVGEQRLADCLRNDAGAQIVLIDVQGAINQVTAISAGKSDLVVIPCRASMADLPEAAMLIEYLRNLFGHLKEVVVRIVLNDIDGLDPKQAPFQKATEYLFANRLPYFSTMIRRRAIYKGFVDEGSSLNEMPGQKETIAKASDNIERLVVEIVKLLDEAEAA